MPSPKQKWFCFVAGIAIFLGSVAVMCSCGILSPAEQIQTASSTESIILNCEAQAAEAGPKEHYKAYDACMKDAGLH